MTDVHFSAEARRALDELAKAIARRQATEARLGHTLDERARVLAERDRLIAAVRDVAPGPATEAAIREILSGAADRGF